MSLNINENEKISKRMQKTVQLRKIVCFVYPDLEDVSQKEKLSLLHLLQSYGAAGDAVSPLQQ